MTSAKGASAQPGSATGASTPFATVNVSPFLWCVPLRGGAAVARPPVPCFFFPDTWISSGGAAAGRRRGLPPRHPRVPSRPPVSPSDRARTCHLRTTTRDRLGRGFAAPAAPGPTRESSAARRRPENSPRPRSPPRRRPQPDVASFVPPAPRPQENVEPRQRSQQRPHHLLVRARPHVHRVAARPARVHAAARHVQAQQLRVVRPAAQQLRLPQVPQRQVRVRRGGVRAG